MHNINISKLPISNIKWFAVELCLVFFYKILKWIWHEILYVKTGIILADHTSTATLKEDCHY